MLRLKQIDLSGFKSFCNRERLRFSGRGIAVVVGPNGCGKSNICDAVNWVLGEQSVKSLRGARMHDVIFAGTKNRPPSGLATVTLTLHDTDRALERFPAENGRSQAANLPESKKPGEVAVTRKLFSNGHSQYILNGKVVRLRDVQDLFLGTGLGPNHYAILEQGRIGQLLTARPLDRRAFVEEAAGVTRFKARRKLAELKLANAALNLERVHDILQEVQRQTNSLKRQAERAERYERYREQLREAQCMLFASRFRHIEARRGRLESEVEEATRTLAEISEETARMESDFSRTRDREQEWEAQLEAERTELSGLRVSAERMRERVEQQVRTVHDNTEHIRQAKKDLESVASRVESLEKGELQDRRVAANLEASVERSRRQLGEKDLQCAVQGAAMSELRTEQESCRKRSFEALTAISHARGHLGKIEETLSSCDRQLGNARERRDEASANLIRAVETQGQRDEELDELRQQVEANEKKRDALAGAVEERGRELDTLRKSAEGKRSEVSSLAARRDSLRQLLEHRAYTTEAVKDIFDAVEMNPREGFNPAGILADFLEVDEGFEKAVEQFLGEDLEYIVVGDWAEAGRGVRLVREEFGGRAAFLVRSGAEADLLGPEPPSSKARPLADHVRLVARNGDPAPGMLPKLRNGYLVQDEATAESLARQHPALHFLLPNGAWYSGNAVQAGRKSTSGPLVLRQQMRELVPVLQGAQSELAKLEESIAIAEEAARRDGTELETVRACLQNLERDVLEVEHDLRQIERTVSELEQSELAAGEEIERVQAERAQAEERMQKVLAERAKLEGLYQESESLAAALTEKGSEGQAALAQLQEERTDLSTEVATLDERRRAAAASLSRTETLLTEQRQRRDDAQRQIQQWTQQSEMLLADNQDLDKRIAAAIEGQERLTLRIADTSRSLQESRTRTTDLIEAVRDQRAQVETARQECSAKEVELARAKADSDHLAADCVSALGEPVAAIAGSVQAELTPEALQAAEEQHRAISEKIERLGPVNILARQEYEEVSQRREFLETQQQDLMDSIAHTRTTIKEIETASREQFDVAFNAINAQFRRVFTTLFGGGIGEMQFTDPDNKDESGIDIVAQPPGKRLQNVALLSGGEKSLTVMALLMATFRYKPSPFCILDEVDSQLDEANTVRLRRLLQEMAAETQFVVITHAKATMEVAETLYGVTMGEAGVSKLVSVRMADNRNEAAQDEAVEEPVLAFGA